MARIGMSGKSSIRFLTRSQKQTSVTNVVKEVTLYHYDNFKVDIYRTSFCRNDRLLWCSSLSIYYVVTRKTFYFIFYQTICLIFYANSELWTIRYPLKQTEAFAYRNILLETNSICLNAVFSIIKDCKIYQSSIRTEVCFESKTPFLTLSNTFTARFFCNSWKPNKKIAYIWQTFTCSILRLTVNDIRY